MTDVITFRHSGNFKKTEKFLKSAAKIDLQTLLERYAKEGVAALTKATPKDSGETAAAWAYNIQRTKNSYTIHWTNSNVNDGVAIAVILQYGHGTRNGGYVQGTDYINPAMKPIFDKIANEAWRAVTGL